MTAPVITARGLTRYYGRKAAVVDLDLDIPAGRVVAMLGRNGSGKSTCLRMILGLLAPTRGSATLFGHDSRSLTPEVRARVGLLTESHPVEGWMRLGEYGAYAKCFHRRWSDELFATMLARFALDPRAKCADLSRGQRAWLALAITLAPDPEVLILDDPSLGLDPVARSSLLEAMVEVMRRDGRTIVFSTHQLDDVERIAEHLVILDQGTLRAACTMDVFTSRVRRWVLRFAGDAPPAPPIPGLLRWRRTGSELRLDIANADEATRHALSSMGAERIDDVQMSFSDAAIGYLARAEENALSTVASRAGSSAPITTVTGAAP